MERREGCYPMTTGSNRDPLGDAITGEHRRGPGPIRGGKQAVRPGPGMNVNSLFSHLPGEVIALYLEGEQGVPRAVALSGDVR